MRPNPIISRILSLVFLLIFSISIIPRNYLHDVLADHTDSFFLLHKSDIPAIEKKGFQCDQYQLVVNIPYEQAVTPIFGYPSSLVKTVLSIPLFSFTSAPVLHASLRGPPALA